MSSFLVNIFCTHCSNAERNPSQKLAITCDSVLDHVLRVLAMACGNTSFILIEIKFARK